MPSLVDIINGLLVLEKKTFKFLQCTFTITTITPLHVNKLESPFHTDALCQDWLSLAQWFWGIRQECEKFNTMTKTMMYINWDKYQ